MSEKTFPDLMPVLQKEIERLKEENEKLRVLVKELSEFKIYEDYNFTSDQRENYFASPCHQKRDQEIERLKKALSFYADTNNWVLPEGQISLYYEIDPKDLEIIFDLDGEYGGKLARETLREIESFGA